MLFELWSEKFEWFGPSPIEPFNSDRDPVVLGVRLEGHHPQRVRRRRVATEGPNRLRREAPGSPVTYVANA